VFIKKANVRVVAFVVLVLLLSTLAWAQQPPMTKFDRDRLQEVLTLVAGDVQKHYYDPKFHGLDWGATIAKAKAEINSETSMNMGMSHIAAALDTLNDSHTFFTPPRHANRYDYGWQYEMVGDHCFVTHVRPNSDADTKGVKSGDELLGLNGFSPNRENLWKMQYVFNVLRPQPALRLDLRDPGGQQRTVDVLAKIREGKRVADISGGGNGNDIWDLIREEEGQDHLTRVRSAEFGDQLMVLKIPEFTFTLTEVEGMIGKARKHQALVLDLRGNPGGYVDSLRFLLGGMFENEVKIADRVGRKEHKPEVAKPSHNPFTGKLIVLVDSKSASAAELFARVVQLEKRGVVIGDRSSGSVMEARHYEEKVGADTVIFFGASITDSDLIMTDGQSLEHHGVTPNEIALPTGKDLAAGRDPLMAHAAELLGVKLSPEDAGKLFPYEWQPQ
jgi:C-terminal processing protease CtpA/Prc